MNVSVETKYLDPTRGAAAQDVSLVLKPVPPPSPRRPSPAESTKTLVNEPLDTEERPNKRSSPRPYPLTKHNLAMSSLRYTAHCTYCMQLLSRRLFCLNISIKCIILL